ncbi:MAG: YdeI/OmpD-associated family protein [Bauldia sp.]
MPAPLRFTAVIAKVGINPYVDVPEAISAALGGPGYIPVATTVDGHAFPANLVPLGGGRFRLFLHGAMRKAAGKDVGDAVAIGLTRDTSPRVEPVRVEFAAALEASPEARAAFAALPPSRQKEILRYLNNLKRADSVARTVAKVVARLRGSDHGDGLAFMTRRPGQPD